jgi:hypothetical protein
VALPVRSSGQRAALTRLREGDFPGLAIYERVLESAVEANPEFRRFPDGEPPLRCRQQGRQPRRPNVATMVNVTVRGPAAVS